MIRISRGEEPDELREERRRRLSMCRLIDLNHRDGPMDLDRGYQCAASALGDESSQGPLCAYCEGQIRETGNPIEHFRPRAAVHEKNGQKVAEGYWWLTWSWENLFRACGTCNDKNHKGNLFPLLDESTRLSVMRAPPGDELPLLIDPTREDPIRFIEFRIQGVDANCEDQWRPFPRRGLKGDEPKRALRTIEVFGLDRGDILKFYTQRVTDLSGCVDLVKAQIDRNDSTGVARSWRRLLHTAFNPCAQYKALAYDYIGHSIDAATRTQWDLKLDAPGVAIADHASRDMERPAHISEVLWLEVCALGRSAPSDESIRELLVRVVALQGCTTQQLAEWFARTEETVEGHLAKLRSCGEIEHQSPHWRAASRPSR